MHVVTVLGHLTGPDRHAPAQHARSENDGPVRIPRPQLPSDSLTTELAHRPKSVSESRHYAAQAFRAWGVVDGWAEVAILVVSELVTNGIEHALPPLVLRLHRDRSNRIWVGVTDGGIAPEPGAWTATCRPEEHGRGLDIVAALAETHGIRAHHGGLTTHWARIAPGASSLGA
ncbi:ATP-binding protein [Streptomyces sp. NPDC087908]|uniref:ATP-binding protein n=1 Tax=Streptomyces sp. NPDC087908 TaxID=3365820 RepID=UPI003825B7AC